MDISYGRINDLGGLSNLVVREAGQAALCRILDDCDIPFELLDTPKTAVPMRDLICSYRRAAKA